MSVQSSQSKEQELDCEYCGEKADKRCKICHNAVCSLHRVNFNKDIYCPYCHHQKMSKFWQKYGKFRRKYQDADHFLLDLIQSILLKDIELREGEKVEEFDSPNLELIYGYRPEAWTRFQQHIDQGKYRNIPRSELVAYLFYLENDDRYIIQLYRKFDNEPDGSNKPLIPKREFENALAEMSEIDLYNLLYILRFAQNQAYTAPTKELVAYDIENKKIQTYIQLFESQINYLERLEEKSNDDANLAKLFDNELNKTVESEINNAFQHFTKELKLVYHKLKKQYPALYGVIPLNLLKKELQKQTDLSDKVVNNFLLKLEKQRIIDLETAYDASLIKEPQFGISIPERGLVYYITWRRE